MAINLKETFKTVASENYDKTNIFYYFLLLFVSGLIGSFTQTNGKTVNPDMGIWVLLSMIIALWSSGIAIVATNNAIFRRQGVFPNPIECAGLALKTAFFSFIGYFVNSIIIIIACLIIMFPLGKINPWLMLLGIFPCMYMTAALIGASFNFFESLSLADWFNYKKGLDFLKKAGKFLLPYFGASIGLFLILATIFGIIFCAVLIPLGAMSAFGPAASKEAMNPLATSIGSLLGAGFSGIFGAYMVELNARLIRATLRKPKPTNRQIRKDINE